MAILSAVLSLPVEAAPSRAPSPARVQLTSTRGDVRLRAPSGAERAAGSPPLALEPGTAVVTGPESGAALLFDDGTKVQIGADTSVLVSPPPPLAGLRLRLRDGTTEAIEPGAELMLAWPRTAGAPGKSGEPDFRIELPPRPAGGPAASPAQKPPPAEEVESAQARAVGHLDIEIVGDEPARVSVTR
ncbi:MAG: hypothetical protein HY554_11450 [Elusimicrobia bacterium]|nr:hypothetical protein [Elusimicrobiota bacterium]